MKTKAIGRPRGGFTLVESVVAIGIFAFVIVGIIGLLGTSLERQRDASFETRAVLAAQQAIDRIRAADGPEAVVFTRGEGLNLDKLMQSHNFTSAESIVFGYTRDGTANVAVLGDGDWDGDTVNPTTSMENDDEESVLGKVLVTVQDPDADGLYDVRVEVSEPANLPYAARPQKIVFTTLASF